MLFITEIISPEGYLLNQKVYMAVLPTKSGEIGVMSNHEKIITELKSGTIKIYKDNNYLEKEIEITSGFAKVIDNILTITIAK